MDTSDSEAFESADENFDSQNEDEDDQNPKSSATLSSEDEDNTVAQVPTSQIIPSDTLQNLSETAKNEIEPQCDTETAPKVKEETVSENVIKDLVADVNVLSLNHPDVEDTKDSESENKEAKKTLDAPERKEVPESKPTLDVKSKVEPVPEVNPDEKINNVQQKLADKEIKPVEVKPVSLDVIDTSEEVGSGWDDDVEWETVEDNKTNVKTEKSETGTGWDDFDNWDTIDENIEETPKVQPVLEKLSQTKETSSWGSWGAWDVTSVISAATESVSRITNVIETGIGAPSPEEMAQIQQKVEPTDEKPLFGFGNLLIGVNQVVSTGLDTLETIGKKTMEVLQEGDPRLEKKRNLLGLSADKPCLSQVLREAKEKAETNQDIPCEKKIQVRRIHFESLFDDYQGLVHLEALEMLSKQCDIKLSTTVESLEGSNLEEFQETMAQVKELCELPDEEEDEQMSLDEVKSKLKTIVEELNIQISFEKLLAIWIEVEEEIKVIDSDTEIHRSAIDTLAKITSAGVEQFHKCAELLLIKDRRSTADEADSLVQLTTTLTALIGLVAAKFSEKLDSLGSGNDNPDLNDLITNVFFEATQSSSYIQDAFQLFVPILQIGAV